jgi:ADP-heptose:LPS heptosyltransferase
LHLAAAIGAPCIGLYGASSARRNGPYGEQHIALQKILLKGGSRDRRYADDAAMRAISVEDVCAACDKLMERRTTRATALRYLQPLAA